MAPNPMVSNECPTGRAEGAANGSRPLLSSLEAATQKQVEKHTVIDCYYNPDKPNPFASPPEWAGNCRKLWEDHHHGSQMDGSSREPLSLCPIGALCVS